MFISAVQSEWLKYRRTLTPWFMIGGPLVMVLAELTIWLLSPYRRTWPFVLLMVYNWWVTLALPFGSTLLAALSSSYERRSGMWSVLRTYPASPSTLYTAKFIVLAAQTAIANVLFAVYLLATNIWLNSGTIPWRSLMLGVAVGWLSGLALLAVMLWLSTAFGFGMAIVLGLVGIVSGVFTSEKPAWLFDPWAWPVRALAPVFGFHANGLPLEPNSPLWDPSVVPMAGVLGVVFAAVFTALGAWWFKTRDVHG